MCLDAWKPSGKQGVGTIAWWRGVWRISPLPRTLNTWLRKILPASAACGLDPALRFRSWIVLRQLPPASASIPPVRLWSWVSNTYTFTGFTSFTSFTAYCLYLPLFSPTTSSFSK